MVIKLRESNFITLSTQFEEENVLVNILFNVTNHTCCTESSFAHISEQRKKGEYVVEVSWQKCSLLYENCNVR